MAELLGGKQIAYPPSAQVNVTFKKAPKAKVGEAPAQGHLPMGIAAERADTRTNAGFLRGAQQSPVSLRIFRALVASEMT